MKIKIGTAFERKSTNELLQEGTELEDFTEDELLKYKGLYSVVSLDAENKETIEIKETIKKKIKSKK